MTLRPEPSKTTKRSAPSKPNRDGRLRVGFAADHGGFALKEKLSARLKKAGHRVKDFGAFRERRGDDYPDYVVPMAEAVAKGKLDRGIAVCGSGVGACIAANKVPGVRAALVADIFSAHQGVEDDDMNVICLGGRVVGCELASDLVDAFLSARFTGGRRFHRRLAKIAELEGHKEE
jgi:ribose 5-phosphate isomerase B